MADQPPEETEVVRLAKLVALMRSAQRQYFETRNPTVLKHSKNLESRVDKACRWVLAHRQGELFTPAPEAVPEVGPYAMDRTLGK